MIGSAKKKKNVKVEFNSTFHLAMSAVVIGEIDDDGLRVYVSDAAIARADKKLCGMSDCLCGGHIPGRRPFSRGRHPVISVGLGRLYHIT
ncbi:MAG: hypothetical protein SOR75_11300 [Synergistes jonesii]|uniref:hypothetical protein n=1 Tax=Synergistes jonesii TaxID=2754 RepID=UPI002A74F89E|nr:hypothetical protein [Synergistes jonesii]MDY2985895.1 hypothetical protein [Synergistes jonesii]